MPRSLGRSEDVAASRQAAQQRDSASYLKIPNTRTPWYLLSMDFVDGYTHFVDLPNGLTQTMTCAGDPEKTRGFAPDVCPVCNHMLKRYREAKKLGGKAGEAMKNETNQMRASYQAKFVAVKGDKSIVTGADGKKRYVANFDIVEDDDESESDVEVGILSLSQAQFTGLTDMIEDTNVPHVKEGADLAIRVLWTKKVKKGNSKYRTVEWSADSRRSDAPDIEIPEEIDFSDEFSVDMELLNNAVALLTGKAVSNVVAEDEEVETVDDDIDEVDETIDEDSTDVEDGYFEDDSDESESDEVEDDGVESDEVEDDEADEEEGDYLEDVGEDDGPEDVIHEEDFEDDIPSEPVAPPKPRRAVKPATKKAAPASAPKRTTPKPSGKKPVAKRPSSTSTKSGKKKL